MGKQNAVPAPGDAGSGDAGGGCDVGLDVSGALEEGANRPPHAESGVRKFFAGKNVFITGGSGLVGKVLIEKILRDCPEVGHIYVLLRSSKKTKFDAHQRLHRDVLASPCFDHLRQIWPSFAKQCVAVQGDVGAPKMGMNNADYEAVCRHCSIVLHCAATVKFNEHLETACRINIDSIDYLLHLCSRLRSLHALVHVSTAYVNATDLSGVMIREERRRLAVDYRRVRADVAAMSHDAVTEATPRILRESGGFPNTYCLTKCIGEQLLEVIA